MKGCSSVWSRRDYGCDVRFRGVTPETSFRARKAGKLLCAQVRAVVPEVRLMMHWSPPVNGVWELRIIVMVVADDLATLNNGPTHRKALAKARSAANLDRSWWELTEVQS